MSYAQRFKNFVSESRRVLRVTKKPTKDEYLTITKVSAIGILVIGAIGFVLHLIKEITNSIAVTAIVVFALVLGLMFIKKNQ